MEFVEIKVHLIAKTQLDTQAVRHWLDGIGATTYEIDHPETISDPEHLVGLAGKRCYKSYEVGLNPNISKIRREWVDYFDNILKSGHGSVTEHANYTFAFENVSRVFTAEMNRHRAGVAISEQSLRYVRFENIPFWLPTSVRPHESDSEDIAHKKGETRGIIQNIVEEIERAYVDLVRLWDFDNMKDFHTKKQITSLLRRIIPLGVATGGVWTMNGRAIRHICTMRCAPEAEEEILHVFSRVAKIMCEESPLLFGDFKQDEQGFWRPTYRKV